MGKVEVIHQGTKHIALGRHKPVPQAQQPFPPTHTPAPRTELAETVRDRRTQGMDFSDLPMAMAPDVAPPAPRASAVPGQPSLPLAPDGLLKTPIGLDGQALDHGHRWQPCVVLDAETRVVVLKSATGRTETRHAPEKLVALADYLYEAWRGVSAAAAAFDPPSLTESRDRR